MTDFFNDNPEQQAVDPGYSGSRADAIANGDLFDIGDMSRQVGFRWPVALTKAAWNDSVAWTDEDSKRQVPQTEYTRLYAVISKCADFVRMRNPSADRMRFRIDRIPRDGSSKMARSVVLQVLAHAGDNGEPVLTIRVPAQPA